jgi:hypothetical protein
MRCADVLRNIAAGPNQDSQSISAGPSLDDRLRSLISDDRVCGR